MFVTIVDVLVFLVLVGLIVAAYIVIRGIARDKLIQKFVVHAAYSLSDRNEIRYDGMSTVTDENGSRSPRASDFDVEELDAIVQQNYHAGDILSWLWPVMLPLTSYRIRKAIGIAQMTYDMRQAWENTDEEVESVEQDSVVAEGDTSDNTAVERHVTAPAPVVYEQPVDSTETVIEDNQAVEDVVAEPDAHAELETDELEAVAAPVALAPEDIQETAESILEELGVPEQPEHTGYLAVDIDPSTLLTEHVVIVDPAPKPVVLRDDYSADADDSGRNAEREERKAKTETDRLIAESNAQKVQAKANQKEAQEREREEVDRMAAEQAAQEEAQRAAETEAKKEAERIDRLEAAAKAAERAKEAKAEEERKAAVKKAKEDAELQAQRDREAESELASKRQAIADRKVKLQASLAASKNQGFLK